MRREVVRYWTGRSIGTQSFIITLSCSLAQKLWVLLLIFFHWFSFLCQISLVYDFDLLREYLFDSDFGYN